jgi:hypothetical protein
MVPTPLVHNLLVQGPRWAADNLLEVVGLSWDNSWVVVSRPEAAPCPLEPPHSSVSSNRNEVPPCPIPSLMLSWVVIAVVVSKWVEPQWRETPRTRACLKVAPTHLATRAHGVEVAVVAVAAVDEVHIRTILKTRRPCHLLQV